MKQVTMWWAVEALKSTSDTAETSWCRILVAHRIYQISFITYYELLTIDSQNWCGMPW